MKSNIETSLTVLSLIASIVGLFFIITKTWQFVNEHIDETMDLLVKLF
ncbi:hypothetical protein [Ureibacillus aquaedulcis]|uniref:Uncharacterized protein n=1 Tax=Ureibacillus aquaedulcis TaxID=3058421 RepID=A0ABT8GXB6_9BACL|nr:hypothetical protein [Ureibacillus sp. BA0131]MDN4495581.1 hypothetical protein [Ureibacillus sp. BA0131]